MTDQAVAGLIIAMFALIAAVAAYLFATYILYRIGRKFGVGAYGSYCVPIYNGVLACRWIGLSGWAALWFYVPWFMGFGLWRFVAPVSDVAAPLMIVWLTVGALYVAFLIYFWGSVARALGKSFWLYGITVVLFSFIPVLFLAFDESKAASGGRQHIGNDAVTKRLALYGVSGELTSQTLEVPTDGLYIGRNPSKASVVLRSNEISNIHVRVWPDSAGLGLWVQDWNSLNGTYYSRSRDGAQERRSKWRVLHGQVLLQAGEHFRLGDKVVEFEVRAA
jgi:hypothetical protein